MCECNGGNMWHNLESLQYTKLFMINLSFIQNKSSRELKKAMFVCKSQFPIARPNFDV